MRVNELSYELNLNAAQTFLLANMATTDPQNLDKYGIRAFVTREEEDLIRELAPELMTKSLRGLAEELDIPSYRLMVIANRQGFSNVAGWNQSTMLSKSQVEALRTAVAIETPATPEKESDQGTQDKGQSTDANDGADDHDQTTEPGDN